MSINVISIDEVANGITGFNNYYKRNANGITGFIIYKKKHF